MNTTRYHTELQNRKDAAESKLYIGKSAIN